MNNNKNWNCHVILIDKDPASAIEEIRTGFEAAGYICDRHIATSIYLSMKLDKPILVEGPISNDSYQGQDGNTRYVTRFEAFTLHAIRRPAGAGKTDDPAGAQPNPKDLAPATDPLDEFPPEEDLPF